MARYARWVSIGGNCNHKLGQTIALMQVARKRGMQVIGGGKGSMCFWHQFALAGTVEQMALTDAEWEKKGHEVKVKKPAAGFKIRLNIPESEWAEVEIAKRMAHGCYGRSCHECD